MLNTTIRPRSQGGADVVVSLNGRTVGIASYTRRDLATRAQRSGAAVRRVARVEGAELTRILLEELEDTRAVA